MADKFDNRSTQQIADDYGATDAAIKALEAGKADLKKELQKRNATVVIGEKYTVTLAEQSTTRLNTQALKEALGADICAEYETTSISVVARVKPSLVPADIAA